jgi:hypothetical protein
MSEIQNKNLVSWWFHFLQGTALAAQAADPNRTKETAQVTQNHILTDRAYMHLRFRAGEIALQLFLQKKSRETIGEPTRKHMFPASGLDARSMDEGDPGPGWDERVVAPARPRHLRLASWS